MSSIRKLTKRLAEPLGLDEALRRTYVRTALLGEHLKFSFVGRPDPSSAIVLAGSGRSGTTWLMEVLSALPGVQPIFEPLHPRFNAEVRRLTGYDTQDPYFRAWYLPPDEDHPDWAALLEKVLKGRIRNYWTDYERTSFFPNRFLIKEVRANLMLGFLSSRLMPHIIYIVRHPCAVVHSRLAVPTPWHADVRDILAQERLTSDCLQPWVHDIAKETSLLGAHAVWWAVENSVALDQLKNSPHFIVFYEQLVMQPKTVLAALLSWLGYIQMPPAVTQLLEQPSRMSDHLYNDEQDRLSRWQQSLPLDDQRRVLTWAKRLGLDMYDEHLLPLHLRGKTNSSQ